MMVRFIFVGRLFSHDVARASSPCKHGQDGRATFFTYKREAHPINDPCSNTT
jgi:hypothetical protein